jgi:aminoglycoside phosphotransferase (APT) family kinase protein
MAATTSTTTTTAAASIAAVGEEIDATFQTRLVKWMYQQPVVVSLILQEYSYGCNTSGPNQLNTSNLSTRLSVHVQRFGYGQSNPTYRIAFTCNETTTRNNEFCKMKSTDNDMETTKASVPSRPQLQGPLLMLVLRSKPPSIIHSSAHAIHREYAILSAIHQYNQHVLATSSSSSSSSSSVPLLEQLIVPVPQVYVYCSDTSIIGTSFYMMEYINGRICTDPSLLEHFLTSNERKLVYQHVIHILALLHTIDLSPYMDYDMLLKGATSDDNTGTNSKPLIRSNNSHTSRTTALHQTSKKLNFVERQLYQLTKVRERQNAALHQPNIYTSPSSSSSTPHAEFHAVSTWMQQLDPIVEKLQLHAPYCPGSHTMSSKQQQSLSLAVTTTTNSTTTTRNTPTTMLIHGDYKIDNIIFHPTLPKVIAIIDWELASIHHDGVDPYCDVANLCMMYFIPNVTKQTTTNQNHSSKDSNNTTVIAGIGNYSTDQIQSLGIPSRGELIRIYCNERHQLSSIWHSYGNGGGVPNVIPSWNTQSSDFSLVYEWSGYYLTFLFFKNCVILQGVLQRTLQGAVNGSSSATVRNVIIPIANEDILRKRNKIKILQQLLPITISLTIDIWKKYPPLSLPKVSVLRSQSRI